MPKTYRPLSRNERAALLALAKGSAKSLTVTALAAKSGLPTNRARAAAFALVRRSYAADFGSSGFESTTAGEQLAAEIVAAVREVT